MEDIMKYKYVISIIEGIIFVLLIIFSLLTIFDLISVDFVEFNEIFNLWSLRIAIISFIFFFSLPYLLVYFKKIGEKALVSYNQKRFKSKFYNQLRENKNTIDFNILNIAQKYDVNLLYVKNYLRDQISQGLLKGELKGDIFYIKEDFKVMDIKERRIVFMKENFGRFIAPHRSIRLKEISANFKVPKDVVKIYIKKLINEKALNGYIQGDTFIRDLSLPEPELLPEEIECPHCGKEIKLNNIRQQ